MCLCLVRVRVWWKNWVRLMVMVWVVVGFRWVSVLMEFRLLKRKCGLICECSSCSFMLCVSSWVWVLCVVVVWFVLMVISRLCVSIDSRNRLVVVSKFSI